MKTDYFPSFQGGYDIAKNELVNTIRRNMPPDNLSDEERVVLRVAQGKSAEVRLRDTENARLSVNLRALVRTTYVDPCKIVDVSIDDNIVDQSVEKMHHLYQSILFGVLYFYREVCARSALEEKIERNKRSGDAYIDPILEEQINAIQAQVELLSSLRRKVTKFRPVT